METDQTNEKKQTDKIQQKVLIEKWRQHYCNRLTEKKRGIFKTTTGRVETRTRRKTCSIYGSRQ